MRRFICGALIYVSLFVIIGTAGSYELDRISDTAFMARELSALVVMYLSIVIGGFNK